MEEHDYRDCEKCGREFKPKYHWSTLCWDCWWESPKGRAYKARQDGGAQRPPPREERKPEAEMDFNTTFLRKLLQLCHPDKHGNSELAKNVTQELLRMKK